MGVSFQNSFMMADYEKKTMDYSSEEAGHPVQPINSNIVGTVNNTGQNTTKRAIKSRHAQMIAIGGTIGTGLFVGSGQALAMGGPLFLLLSYVIISVIVYGVVTATTEMSSYLPVRGCSMSYYGTRFFSRSLGFAMGW